MGNTLSEEQKQLVINNHNLIYHYLKEHNLSIDLYYGMAAIGLCKAAFTYDSSKCKFSTYALKCISNEVLIELRKGRRVGSIPQSMLVYYDAEVINFKDQNEYKIEFVDSYDLEDDAITKVRLEKLFSVLNDDEKDLIRLYMEGNNQLQISKIKSCSQAHVSRLLKKIRKKFNKN